MSDDPKAFHFDRTFLPHLDAAYRLARWLVRDDNYTQDIVQDAYLRAFRFASRFRGSDPRSWILTIVRNAAFSWLKRSRGSDSPSKLTPFVRRTEALARGRKC